MNYYYDHKAKMSFIGFHTEIKPGEGYIRCPEFWDEEYNKKYARLWQTMSPQNDVEMAILENGIGMYAICSDNGSSFEYWIAGIYKGGIVPEGLSLFALPESDWVIFSSHGPLPESLQTLNSFVLQEWIPTEGRKVNAKDDICIEVYSSGDMQSPDYECGIWIPLDGSAKKA